MTKPIKKTPPPLKKLKAKTSKTASSSAHPSKRVISRPKKVNATTKALQKKDISHHLHPFTDFKDLAKYGSYVIVKGKGVMIWDTEGHKIIDSMSGLWCVNMGYGRKDLVKAATKQLQKLPYYNSFFASTNRPAIELSEQLCKIAPNDFNHVMFANSGSEGNDTLVRMVRRYWDILGQPKRKVFIGRFNGYHGSTLAGASLGGMTWMHEQGDLPLPGFAHIQQPYYFEHAKKGESEDAFGIRAARWLEDKILEIGADKVAAFIGEPIQGSGGVIVPPKTYWKEIQRIVDQYGILLAQDEVITGFGRMGYWFGCQHPHIATKPDIITFAKGVTSGYLPLGGVIVGKRISNVMINQGKEFYHGFTYSGHPVSCAVALATIKAMQDEKILDHVRNTLIPYFKKQLMSLSNHPLVGEIQAIGMMAGMILVRHKSPNQVFPNASEVGLYCREHCLRHGVIMRAVGHRMIIAPPLIITPKDIDKMIKRIRKSLDITAKAFL